MPLALNFVTHSEIGLVRKNNQDSGFASPRMLVIADGMGGAAAGDLASTVAIDTISRIDDHSYSGDEMLEAMAGAVHRANDRIADLVADDPSLEGMGTTLTGALFDSERIALAHIGDSRAYLLRDSRLERLTHDHSWVQSLVDDGKITEEEATVHPHRSLLLKVLNGQVANDPDLTMVEVRDGDRLLFCSDGLCGLVDDPQIESAMSGLTLEEALQELIELAHAEGGIDNISIILADVISPHSEPVEGTEPSPLPEPVEGPAPAKVEAPHQPTLFELAEEPEAAPLPEPVEGPEPVDGPEPPDEPIAPPAEPEPGPPTGSGPSTGSGGEGLREDAVIFGAAAEREIPELGTRDGDETAIHGLISPASPAEHDDEARYEPQAPAKRRILRPLIGILALVILIGGGLGAGYAWSRTQYFVGESAGQVAIFQGLPDPIPGVPLSQVYEIQQLQVADLPPFFQEKVRSTISATDLAAARRTVNELMAEKCPERPAPEPPASTSSPTVSTSPSSTPAATATATATATTTEPPEQGC